MANQIKKKYLDQEVISYFDDQIDAVGLSVTAEETARIAADQALQGEIDTLQAEMDAAEGRLDTVESTLLVKADLVGGLVPANQLPSYVDDVLEFSDLFNFPVTGEDGKIYVALDTNKVYRWSGSAYIQITSGAVDTVNGQNGVVVLDADDILMVSEAVSVENKLISLQSELDIEATVRSGSDILLQDNLNAEESARIAADGVLQTNIDSEESARIAADSGLQFNIDNEEASRIAADSSLDTRVTALENALSPTLEKVKFDLTSTNISDGYVELAHSAIANSVSAFVDRLAIHEDEDFTLSIVGGVTRITFAGALVSPGQSNLDASDNIYVRYQYLA